MAEVVQDRDGSPAHPTDDETLFQQVAMMYRAFMASPVRNRVLLLSAAIFVVIVLIAFGQILLNRWNRPFYDAIERRDVPTFLFQLLVFAAIAGGLLVGNVAQSWLNLVIRLKLREGLTHDLIAEWMRPGRAFRLANAGAIGVNPDQRMQQDADHLTELSSSLGVGLLQSTILLISFIAVLWSVSSGFVFHVGGHSFEIPGYMVWAAFLYAGSASWLSWLVGRPLIERNATRYQREAELRFSMMRINEHIDAISLARGEADEERRLNLDLDEVMRALRRIFMAQVNLLWVTDAYGWITTVAPIIIAAPVYFSGNLSFGGLMMAVGAFNQVHTSLRWFITNISQIADWRATLLRVAAFRSAILKTDVLHGEEKRIDFAEAEGKIVFDGLEVASPSGCTRLVERHAEVAPGDRVLVSGGSGAGKPLFFRAIAGLWPWGNGTIRLPAGEEVTFVPRMPYLPPGSLRAVVSYPQSVSSVSDADLAAVLQRLGLERLAKSLDRDTRWERELGDEEQRLIGFARLALHKPKYVVIDEALDTMEETGRRRVLALLEQAIPDAAIINIGRRESNGHFFTRALHLEHDVGGRKLKPFGPKEVQPRKSKAKAGRQPAPATTD